MSCENHGVHAIASRTRWAYTVEDKPSSWMGFMWNRDLVWKWSNGQHHGVPTWTSLFWILRLPINLLLLGGSLFALSLFVRTMCIVVSLMEKTGQENKFVTYSGCWLENEFQSDSKYWAQNWIQLAVFNPLYRKQPSKLQKQELSHFAFQSEKICTSIKSSVENVFEWDFIRSAKHADGHIAKPINNKECSNPVS